MIVNVSATLIAGKLINGSKKWPINVGFQGNTDMQSFYLHLKNDGKKMELDNLMQDLLGDADTERMPGCYIETAGIFYINKAVGKQAVFRLVKEIEADRAEAICRLLDNVTEACISNSTRKITDYICMWLTADLCDLNCLSGLIQLGYSQKERLIILVCLFKDEKQYLNKEFLAELPVIKLLSLFEFKDVRLKYSITGPDSKKLSLHGDVSLSFQTHQFVFTGDLYLDEKGYAASLSSVGKMDVLTPFTGMVDELAFDNLAFSIKCLHANESSPEICEYYFSGDVVIGGLKTTGKIYFSSDKIILAAVKMDSNFSLAALWNHIFPGYRLDKGSFDIKFLEGSELYYCTSETGSYSEGIYYEKGFGLKLYTELVLINTFPLEGMLYITKEKVRAALYSLKAIDLGIIKIEGDCAFGPGISFIYEKDAADKKKTFEISGNIIVFNESVMKGSVQYYKDKNEWGIRAEIKLPELLKAFFGDCFIIIYSSINGFKLAYSYNDNNLDFMKIFERFLEMKKGKCKSISGGNKNKIRLKFELESGISGDTNNTSWSAKLIVSGTVKLVGKNDEIIVSRALSPCVSINISSTTSFSNLPNLFLGALEDVVFSIIKMLFQESNFKELKNVLIYLYEGEIEKYAAELVCRNLLSEENFKNLTNNTGGGSGDGKPDTEKKPKPDTGKKPGGGGEPYIPPVPPPPTEPVIIIPPLPIPPGWGSSEQEDPKDDPDTGKDKNDKLHAPEFTLQVNDFSLSIKVKEVEAALGYKIDFMWNISDKQDYLIDYYPVNGCMDISLLDIPVWGKVYIAVCALHEKIELCSDWIMQELPVEVTMDKLISWAYSRKYCIRNCYEMLKNHGINIKDMSVLGAVLKIYQNPDTPDIIAKNRFDAGDKPDECLKYLNNVYPHMPGKDIMLCMCQAGYNKFAAAKALVQLRPWLDEKELAEMVNDIK